MRRFISAFLTIAFAFSFAMPVNATELSPYNESAKVRAISIDEVIDSMDNEELQAALASKGSIVFTKQMPTNTLGLVEWTIEVHCTIAQRASGQYYFSAIDTVYLGTEMDWKIWLVYTTVKPEFSNSYYRRLSDNTILEVETDIKFTTASNELPLPYSWTESHSVQTNASDV